MADNKRDDDMVPSMAQRSLFPVEIWDHIGPFLTGWELHHVSVVNRELRALFLSDLRWPRASPRCHTNDKPDQTSGRRVSYLGKHSFAFERVDEDDDHGRSGVGVGLTASFSIPFLFGSEIQAFTIEIWLAVGDQVHDGILLGTGTPFHVSPSWNPLFETWVRVDDRGVLYSSLIVGHQHTKNQRPVAQLQRNRWHHLVITFDTSEAAAVPRDIVREHWRITGEERVYLDGLLCSTQQGSLSRFWLFNSFVLLGTGCYSQTSETQREGKRWFPFCGVVDDLRVWQTRLTADEVMSLARHQPLEANQPLHSWKALAATAAPKQLARKCIEFQGSHPSRPLNHGVSIAIVNQSNFQRGLMEDRFEFHPFCPDPSSSFAIEVWFYLLPEDDENWRGGVLIGAQSREVGTPYTPSQTRPLIYIDRERRLFASVLDEIPYPSARGLHERRWYHLILRYSSGHQDVFLNGANKRSSHGALLRNWGALTHMQVGTGCMHSVTRGLPVPGYRGWYGFHGRVREVRIWGPRLKDRQLVSIICSSDATQISAISHPPPVYSMRRDGRLPHFQYVQCSRPSEAVFTHRVEEQPASHRKQQLSIQTPSKRLDSEPLARRAVERSSQWLTSMWRRASS